MSLQRWASLAPFEGCADGRGISPMSIRRLTECSEEQALGLSGTKSRLWSNRRRRRALPSVFSLSARGPRHQRNYKANALRGVRLFTKRLAARPQRHCGGDPSRRRLRHTEDQHRRDDTQRAGGEECRQIAQELSAHDAGGERGAGGADLMASEDPAEDHAGAFAAETIGGQFHRRWHGRDPVKTVENREK